MRTSNPKPLAVAFGLSLIALVACGGSGGSGAVPGGSSGSANVVLTFQPTQPSPGNFTVSMDEVPGPADDTVAVRVLVTGTSDVFGASFSVAYDETEVEYVQYVPGTLVETNGTGIYDVAVQPGLLVVGIAPACGGCSGVDVTTSTRLVDLVFRAVSDSTTGSALAFTSADLLDSQPPGPSPIPGIVWYGGNLVAN